MTRALTTCPHVDDKGVACTELTERGRCARHRAEGRQASDARRPNATDRGYGPRWRRTRAAYIAAHPVCECDDPDCTEPTTDVHHLDGLGPTGPRGHDWDNLKGLAHVCHSRITAREQPGGFNARSVAT
jgi:5-methylcytosine-specific restriction protein A